MNEKRWVTLKDGRRILINDFMNSKIRSEAKKGKEYKIPIEMIEQTYQRRGYPDNEKFADFYLADILPGAEKQCKVFSYDYIPINDINEITCTDDVFLICGAGLLPEAFVKKNIVVNAHPGYIPVVRGLDSLKWAIYNGDPIGVTTHLIGDEIDAGEIIERRIVPVFWNDTFHAVAQRQYEMEIQMLINSLAKLNDKHEFFKGEGVVHKRMPHSYETRLFERFSNLVKNVQIIIDDEWNRK